jgi:putative ABC transport system permease protein
MSSRLLQFLAHFVKAWTWRMAWRESRTSRKRLLFFSTSIILGIAALVAIGSFGDSLQKAMEEQAKALLGTDLVLSSREAFSPAAEAFFESLGGRQSREISFSSMIYFTRTQDTRLVQVRALSGDFPFYGMIETAPAGAALEFRSGGGALVEESLLIQYSAEVGDLIRIGELTTPIVGRLKKVPGETVAFSTISPRVYLSLADLPKTGLLRAGSLARYKVYFKFPAGTNIPLLVENIRPKVNAFRLAYNTVEKRKKDLGNSMENLSNFLNLVGFVALLLGGIGIASAVHVHIQQKFDTIAVLRCLGCSTGQTFAIYLLQGLALGLLGTLVGATLGIVIQFALPRIMADFLPLAVSFNVSWPAVIKAMGIGLCIALLFSMLPLLSVRSISPLAVIRSFYEERPRAQRDPLLYGVYLGIASSILFFSLFHTHGWRQGLGFASGLGVAYGLLFGLAKLLMKAGRRILPSDFPYVWRQGVANLYRPHNRTVLLTLSLGLGTFLVLTLYLTQQGLLRELVSSGQGNQSNLVLFDIQSDQKEALEGLVRARNLSVLDEAPVVTMRITSLKGDKVERLLAQKKELIPHWALRHEYRTTYYEGLRPGEKIVAGQWPRSRELPDSAIPISIEEEIAKDLRVGIGDEIVFDVQGIALSTRIASVRQVDWHRVQPNFFVVFPRGVLEEAPTFHVMTLRVGTPGQSAALQREVVQKFPNVSAIDLTLILQTIEAILNKISFVLRFMALFTVVTGLLVLTGAILTGRFQRIRESILLRTLGASRAQILKILVVEYLCLGLFSAFIGTILALIASWGLAIWVFEVRFTFLILPLLTGLLTVCSVTVLVGLLGSRGILDHPPLAVLRAEV